MAARASSRPFSSLTAAGTGSPGGGPSKIRWLQRCSRCVSDGAGGVPQSWQCPPQPSGSGAQRQNVSPWRTVSANRQKATANRTLRAAQCKTLVL